MRHGTFLIVGVVAGFVLLLAACGGDSGDAPAEGTPTSTAAPTDGGAATSTTSAETGDDSEPTTSAGGGTEAESAGGDLSLVPPGETDIMGNPAGQGFVEIDGARYDFVLNGACQHIFGAVQGAGSLADGSDGGVDSIIPPEDWETDTAAEWDPPYVAVDIADTSWRAEAGAEHIVGGETVVLTPEQSAVTSFSNDGSRVAGEAVFFNTFNFNEVETASGTFELYCP